MQYGVLTRMPNEDTTMRILATTLCLLTIASPAGAAAPAYAISHYDAATMSCAEIQSDIHAEGAVVLRYRSATNPAMPHFGRYVDSIRSCTQDELAASTSVPAADTKSCPVKMCVDAR